MLNKDNVRELAYVVKIDGIEPIIGSDNCEAAVVGGWRIMTRKGTFNVGDPAIYFEIDSKVPATEQFAFLEKKHYKVKTQKYSFGGKGNFVSQGLLMHPSDFGWKSVIVDSDDVVGVMDTDGVSYFDNDESRFLTQKLGVVYASDDDNKRKANSVDKYKRMAQRHPKLGKTAWWKFLYGRKWGKKLLFVFFGKPRDKKGTWPAWVSKTDEERVQNMPWVLSDKRPWIVTEKIDGTSTTFTIKRGKFNRFDFYVCSRNVCFDKPDKHCFYETNVYTEMAEKYDVENKLREFMTIHKELDTVTIQGETYGSGIQKRDYGLKDHDFAAFNFIVDGLRLPSNIGKERAEELGIPWVPILDEDFILPDTVDELLEYATDKSQIDGGMREGVVIRDKEGKQSFKAVSNEYLLKFHC